MKIVGLSTCLAVLLGSTLALAAPPGAPAAPAATARATTYSPPLMTTRGQAQSVRAAMKSSLGITGVKGLKVTLEEKPNAFQSWVDFHAQGQQGPHGQSVSVAGIINPYKGRLTDDVGHSIGHVGTITLLDTVKKPVTAPAPATVSVARPADAAVGQKNFSMGSGMALADTRGRAAVYRPTGTISGSDVHDSQTGRPMRYIGNGVHVTTSGPVAPKSK